MSYEVPLPYVPPELVSIIEEFSADYEIVRDGIPASGRPWKILDDSTLVCTSHGQIYILDMAKSLIARYKIHHVGAFVADGHIAVIMDRAHPDNHADASWTHAFRSRIICGERAITTGSFNEVLVNLIGHDVGIGPDHRVYNIAEKRWIHTTKIGPICETSEGIVFPAHPNTVINDDMVTVYTSNPKGIYAKEYMFTDNSVLVKTATMKLDLIGSIEDVTKDRILLRKGGTLTLVKL